MANVPAILVIKDSKKANANLVFDAMGRGPATFSVPLVAADDDDADHTTTPTHWLAQDMSATDTLTTVWLAMTDGDLPQIGGVWGENGVISAQDAMDAMGGGKFQVYSAGGLDVDANPNAATDWRESVLAGANLKRRPDAPL